MNITKHTIKRTALATAMATALGSAALPDYVLAAQFEFQYTGWFTMMNPDGSGAFGNSDASSQRFYGNRTAISGTIIFDTTTGAATATMAPFSFGGADNAAATNISFQTINNNMVLGNLGFNWSGNNGIPVSIAWDATGLLDAINQGMAAGDTIGTGKEFDCAPTTQTKITCGLAATDDFSFGGKGSYTLPIGPVPLATTTFNTTDIGTVVLGTNPSGTLPLIADTIGGSPMLTAPFLAWNANFEFETIFLKNDGTSNITAPADINLPFAQVPGPPQSQGVNLGTAAGIVPIGDTAEYCLADTNACAPQGATTEWVTDDGTNTVTVPVTQTVNTLNVDWRSVGAGAAFDTQTVTVTVSDTIPPSIDTMPIDVSVNVTSITDQVCFTGTTASGPLGYLTASDVWEPSPTIEYSLDGFTFFPSNPSPGQDCSTTDPSTGIQFGPNANTVIWRVQDSANPPNERVYNQTVTLNLPTGIVGKACTLDLAYSGFRSTLGDFIMRDANGAQVGTTDTGVTGIIDTTKLCTDPLCTNLGTGDDIVGATLDAGQPFQSLLWRAEPVTLFGPGDWSFDACPGDQSTQCDGDPQPRLLSMTVKDAANNGGVPQLGAHMLFAWGATNDIDVAVVWDVDCGSKQLTTTDSDGDGILGIRMVDGPFRAFNAAFDISATGVDEAGITVPLIADGGYLTSIPAYRNPVPRSSPLPLSTTEIPPGDMPTDSTASRSCVGGCYSFEVSDLIDANDSNGAYKYAQVVLPQTEAIPFWSLYRKFDTATNTWRPYALDARNNVKSAAFDVTGLCPEPGAGNYKVADTNSQLTDKLQGDDNCIQLTIEDNGPNDTDSAIGTVKDPSGVAAVSQPPLKDPATKDDFSDGCTISKTPVDPMQRADWWLLGGLLGWLGFRSRGKRSR